jgi:uncharacterized Zn finger protein
MQLVETDRNASPPDTVLSSCPECEAGLAVLRIIPGRAGCEYWTLRCTRCGGIHLDIVNNSSASQPA